MGRIKPSKRLTVCLLSSHAPILSQLRRDLEGPQFQLLTLRLGAAPIADLSHFLAPPIEVFIIDSLPAARATQALVARVAERYPLARLLVIARAFNRTDSFTLLRLGVKGVVGYDQLGTQLRRALVHVAKGGFWMPRALLFDFLASLLGRTQPDTTKGIAAQLSHREKGVYDALLENLSNKEIASRLYMSVSAVKTYVSRVLAKFGVQRRTDLILLNYQRETPPGKPVGHRPKGQLAASAVATKLGLTKETGG